MLAWLFARSTGRTFRLRIEDLDRARSACADRQIADLAALGLDWDGPIAVQSKRLACYQAALAGLTGRGLTYECFCTRREVQQAASAPHGPVGAYPGTCRNLTEVQRSERRAVRSAAIRLRAGVPTWSVNDLRHGTFTGVVDDFVLRRGDGVFAYNLAVVVDDGKQGIDQVVRGDDLLASSPRQAYLADLLGYPAPVYAHVPLAVNRRGQRLAKRDGAVTLADLRALGWSAADALGVIAVSLGLAGPGERVGLAELRERFDPAALPREPWVYPPA